MKNARIAAEQSAPAAPAAATGAAPVGLDDEVTAVADELGVHAEGAAQRTFDLRGRVVGFAQVACRGGDQRPQGGQIRKRRAPQPQALSHWPNY